MIREDYWAWQRNNNDRAERENGGESIDPDEYADSDDKAADLLNALADACGFEEKEEAEPEAPRSIRVVCPRDGLPATARLWAGAYLCDVCGERDHERRGA